MYPFNAKTINICRYKSSLCYFSVLGIFNVMDIYCLGIAFDYEPTIIPQASELIEHKLPILCITSVGNSNSQLLNSIIKSNY